MGIGLEFGVFFSFQAWIGRCGQRDEVDLFLPFNFMEKLPFLSRVEFFGVGFGGGRGCFSSPGFFPHGCQCLISVRPPGKSSFIPKKKKSQ